MNACMYLLMYDIPTGAAGRVVVLPIGACVSGQKSWPGVFSDMVIAVFFTKKLKIDNNTAKQKAHTHT